MEPEAAVVVAEVEGAIVASAGETIDEVMAALKPDEPELVAVEVKFDLLVGAAPMVIRLDVWVPATEVEEEAAGEPLELVS